jgi:hypothetical protein
MIKEAPGGKRLARMCKRAAFLPDDASKKKGSVDQMEWGDEGRSAKNKEEEAKRHARGRRAEGVKQGVSGKKGLFMY